MIIGETLIILSVVFAFLAFVIFLVWLLDGRSKKRKERKNYRSGQDGYIRHRFNDHADQTLLLESDTTETRLLTIAVILFAALISGPVAWVLMELATSLVGVLR